MEQTNYSGNGKISIRQMSRMMFLELFGFGTLVLPSPLAKLCQADGVWAILVAGFIWGILVYGLCKCKAGDISGSDDAGEERQQQTKRWFQCGIWFFQTIFFAVTGGFLLYLLASIVERQLLDSSYLWMIVITILFAGGYGIIKGIECRARIYEILFWILLLPLIGILVIALWNVTPDYWLPIFACGWGRFIAGVGVCMLGFSPALLTVLLQPSCIEPNRVAQMGARVLGAVSIGCGAVYLLLVGIFQPGVLALLKYPVISLMSVVQIPGNLMERLDAPMVTIWFFSLFALFHSLCYHCVDGLRKLSPKKKHNIGKVFIGMILILITSLMMLLGGCGKKGPEAHRYPLAVGICQNNDTGQMEVTYGMANTNKSQDPASDVEFSTEIATVVVDSLFQAQEKLDQSSDQTLDLNHAKVFIVSRELLSDTEEKEQLFLYFLENESMAWNTYLLFTEETMEDLFGAKIPSDKALGTYVEELLFHRQNMDTKTLFTVQDYMSLFQNKTETMLAPMLAVEDKKLEISHYVILSRGMDRGSLSMSDSIYAQLFMGKQERLSLLLTKDQYVTLQNIRLERTLEVGEDLRPKQKILVKANLKLSADWVFTREEKQALLKEASGILEENLNEVLTRVKNDYHADLTNSYLVISGYHRDLWKLYKGNPDAYEKQLETQVEVRLKLLET